MESTRTFIKKYYVLILLVVILGLFGLAYGIGYRIVPGGVARVGDVTFANLPVGTTVYADQMLMTTVKKTGPVSLELVPGNHSMIISAPGTYPWSSVVSVSSGVDRTVDPIIINMNVSVTKLTGADATAAANAIEAATLPTMQAPLMVSNGCAKVYVDNNQLIEDAATSTPGCTPPAYLCTGGSCEPTIVFSPLAPLANVFPYPNRKDTLAVAFGGTIYAIALDPTSPQFFAPLVRGSNIKFGQLPDGTIVLHDGANISKLGL